MLLCNKTFNQTRMELKHVDTQTSNTDLNPF